MADEDQLNWNVDLEVSLFHAIHVHRPIGKLIMLLNGASDIIFNYQSIKFELVYTTFTSHRVLYSFLAEWLSCEYYFEQVKSLPQPIFMSCGVTATFFYF